HSIIARLARILLMCSDRLNGDHISITHELMADILGAYRPNVTCAIIKLKEQKLIDCDRGTVKLLDKKGLKSIACECYDVINELYNGYLSLIELRSLNRRAEQASEAFKLELRRHREITKESRLRLQNLQNAMGGIKSLSG